MHDKTIRSFLAKKRCPAELAEDIAHDVYCKLIEKYDNVNVRESIKESLRHNKIAPYMWRIIDNTYNDYHRRSKDKFHVDINETEAEKNRQFSLETYATNADGNVTDCVKISFQRFAEDHPQRAVALELAAIEGWSIKELANYLERSEGATREYLRQCRKALRPYIEHCTDYL